MAAVLGPGTIHSNIICHRRSGGTHFGGTICGMTLPCEMFGEMAAVEFTVRRRGGSLSSKL